MFPLPPQGDQSKGINLSLSSIVESVRSVQGGDGLEAAAQEVPPEAFEVQEVTNEDIPLMPLVIKTLFVSNVTGENVSSLRKLIYKVTQFADSAV